MLSFLRPFGEAPRFADFHGSVLVAVRSGPWLRCPMNVYTPAGYLIVTTALLFLAASPLFRAADASWHAQSERAATIDGLRGFLALGVFFHHAAIYHRFLTDGVWTVPPSSLYTQLGQSGVILFFMITGYLFWGKAIEVGGKMDWRSLYIGRIFRIGPMYYLVTLAMLAVVFLRTGFVVHGPASALWHELARLSLLGYLEPSAPINGYPRPWLILAGVTWTLHFEWIFYLLVLPISAAFFCRPSVHLPYAMAGIALTLLLLVRHPGVSSAGFAAFFSGMLCASLRVRGFSIGPRRNANWMASGFAALLLGLLLCTSNAYAPGPVLVLAVLFALFSSGCTVFGLLTLRASKRLGEISYGIYLLQGLALFAFFHVPAIRTFALASVTGYWTTVLAAAAALVGSALLAHVVVEKPGIRMGRRLVGSMRRKTLWSAEPS